MKHLKTFLKTLAFGMPLLVHAEPVPDSHQGDTPIILEKSKDPLPIKRPQAPDRQVVACYYDGEVMTLCFVISEGNAILTLTDEDCQSTTYTIDTSTLEVRIAVGDLNGIISIQLETERGNIFVGVLYV
ncbi:MAG: hypothetical protein K2K98_14570 [Muribaculaceae bacterium]|nr:hypothetical protein [Muribaculaceae bacterium]